MGQGDKKEVKVDWERGNCRRCVCRRKGITLIFPKKKKKKVEGIVIFFLSFISSKTVTRKSVKRIEVTPLRDDLKLDGKYGKFSFSSGIFFLSPFLFSSKRKRVDPLDETRKNGKRKFARAVDSCDKLIR